MWTEKEQRGMAESQRLKLKALRAARAGDSTIGFESDDERRAFRLTHGL